MSPDNYKTMEPIHDVDDAFDSALEHHQAGRLAEAEALYRRILALDPEHPGALYLLGGIAFQGGDYEQAFALVSAALAEEPDDPDALHLLASIAHRRQDHAFALEQVDRALALHPGYAQAHHTRADILLAQGQDEAALAGYRQALQLNPQLPEAHCNIGNILKARQQSDAALASYRQALALQPAMASAHCGIGELQAAAGDWNGAIASLRQATALAPAHGPAHGLLGHALRAAGDAEGAVASFRRLLELQPDHAPAHNQLGNALKDLGRLDDAIAAYRRAIAAHPEYAEAYSNLGIALRDAGQFDAAIDAYRHALRLRPDAAALHANLANVYYARDDFEPAIASYERAVALDPALPELHNSLGRALAKTQRFEAALACYRQALALRPNYTEALSNLGNAQLKLWRVDEAVASFRQALAIEPEFAEVYTNLGIALKESGRLDAAIECFRKAVALKPEYIEGYTNYLIAVQYSADYSPERLLADHRAFGDHFEGPWRARWPHHAGRRQPKPRLRVGFVSGDFCEHPVGFFLENALAHLDRGALDIVLYPTVIRADALARRLQDMGFAWRPLAGLSDAQAEQRIATDGIDILVDLAGHTADHRLQLFARKPAPVQVGWLGYWATTGLQAMDYILCDPHSVPAHEAGHFVERPWYLPDTRLCFTPPRDDIAVAPPPALAAGHITFGCFNNLAKMTDAVVAVWAQVLHRVAGSRLLLKGRTLADAGTRDAVRQRFAAHGIDAGRLLLEQHASRGDYLQAYHRVDIALDPFPFTGATTSVEGLWMGVPFVTLRGDRLVGHQGEAILHNVGMPDWIAADAADYVALAAAKAADLHALAAVRAGLRARLLASPLCDGPRFARNLQAAFEGMWRDFCDAA